MNLEEVRNRINKVATPGLKKWVRRIFQVAWALVLIVLIGVIWKYRDQVIPYLKQAHYGHLALSLIFYLLAFIFVVAGWKAILRPFAAEIPWWKHAVIYGFTLAARRLPGTVWYIGGRLIYYQRIGISRRDVSVASSIELIADLVTSCLVGLILLPFGIKLSPATSVLLVIGALAGLAVIQPPFIIRLMQWLKRPLTGKIGYLDTLKWVGWYAAMWIASGLMVAEIVSAFRPLTSSEIVYVTGAWALSGAAGLMTFFLPSTFGVPELTLAALLSNMMPLPMAGFITIITKLINLLFEVALSAVCYPIVSNSPDLKAE